MASFRVLTSMLVVVDAFYLHHDMSKKRALDDVLVEASEKRSLIATTA